MLARIAAPVLVAAAIAAACGAEPGPQPPTGSIRVTLSDYSFAPNRVHARPGTAVLYLVNSGTTLHDMVVTDGASRPIGRAPAFAPGKTALLKLERLQPGMYVFFCDLEGHRDLGMEGELVVD